ncbi:MAG: ribonuclease HI family protein [Candidatus Micrarchaeia archaeon]
MAIINTDGACSGNPGKMGIGAVITENGKTLIEISEAIGNGTNNIAEYTAVIRALEEAKKLGIKEITLRSDSLLVIKQLRNEFKVKEFHLRELKRKVVKVSEGMAIKYEHIPREENGIADELSKRAIGLCP